MRFIDRLSLKLKLSLAPAACLAMLALTAAVALWGFDHLASTLQRLTGERLPSYTFSARLDSDLRDMNALMNESIALAAVGYGDEDVAKVDRALLRLADEVRGALTQRMARQDLSEEEAEELRALLASYQRYEASWKEAMKMKASALVAAATSLDAARAEYRALRQRVSDASVRKLEQTRAEAAVALESARKANVAIGAVALAAVVVAVAFVGAVTRRVLVRLGMLSRAARQLASGDLTSPVEVEGRDEIARLMKDVESVRHQLAGSLGTVHETTESLRAAAQEIAAGTEDLGHRTENTSASLQNTTASLRQLTTAVDANVQVARSAAQHSSEAAVEAAKGGELMDRVTDMMGEVTASSRRIAEVIEIIDHLAAQTNILALNAAVESARAGEHGRGFAVVAGEVRSLAKRSREAAHEISVLIREADQRVQQGRQLVEDAGASIGALVTSVQDVSVQMTALCDATVTQGQDIVAINRQLGVVELSTEQNAALVEQSTAATISLRGQADNLSLAVSRFKLC